MNKSKHSNRFLGSGILLAFTSSLCCITPLLALFGTVGGAVSMFNWVAPLRPYLLVATAFLLALALYQAYKPIAKDDCGCAEKKSLLQSKTFLWIIILLSVGLSTFPYYAPYLQNGTPKQTLGSVTSYQQTVLHIQGMSCTACEGHVNNALLKKKGIKGVTTSYSKGQAVVKFDSTQISLPQIASIVEIETGYTVVNIKDHVK